MLHTCAYLETQGLDLQGPTQSTSLKPDKGMPLPRACNVLSANAFTFKTTAKDPVVTGMGGLKKVLLLHVKAAAPTTDNAGAKGQMVPLFEGLNTSTLMNST